MKKYEDSDLLCVEDDGTLRVVSPHHLHGEPVDGGLEVGLLRVHHHAHVLLLGVLQQPRLSSPLLSSQSRWRHLEYLVEPVDHVPELLLLQRGQRPRVVPGDELLHLAGLEVGDLQRSSCHQVLKLSLSSPGTCRPDPSWC